MSKERVTKAIGTLTAIYPRQAFSRNNLDAYLLVLGAYPVEAVEAAIADWIRDGGPFFPSAPELIGRIGEHAIGVVAGFPTGDTGWAEVCRVRKQHGSYRDRPVWSGGGPVERWPGWSHPAIEQAVQFVGGWEAVCLCEYDDEPSMRSRFIGHLNSLRDRARRDIQLHPDHPMLGGGDDRETDDGLAIGAGR